MPSEIRITRRKIYPSGGSYRVAWKFIYNVYGSNGAPLVEGAELLSIARRVAKQAAKGTDCTVVEAWKGLSTIARKEGE